MGNFLSAGGLVTGLLEQPVLMVSAVVGGRRGILGPDGPEAGFALGQRRAWWSGHVLSVHELPDSPLVFTLRRRWLLPFRHEVRDAEGELVGEIAGTRILDRWGEAVMWSDAPGPSGRWLDTRNRFLARWEHQGAGVRLEFAADVRHDPFACMLLLAATILRT